MFKSTLITAGATLALTAATALAATGSNRQQPTLQSANDTTPGGGEPTETIDLCSPEHNTSGRIGVDQLTLVFANWGIICEQPCGAATGDWNNDGTTDVMDLIRIVTEWGACPDAAEALPGKADQFENDFGNGASDSPDTPDQTPSLLKPDYTEEVGP